MRICIVVLTALLSCGVAHAEQATVWIGMAKPTHGEQEGIYRATLDLTTGALDRPVLAAEIGTPEFLTLHPNGKLLYAAGRLPNGQPGVAAFEVAGNDRSLRLVNSEPTGDGAACHLAVDRTGRCLFTAQYGNRSVAAFPLGPDGKILPRSELIHQTGSGPNKQRQEGSHPHWVGADADNRFLFVPDLGADRVVIYAMDTAAGKLKPHGEGFCPAGSGPRHMVFHPNGRFAFVVNELDISVTTFKYDAAAGTLEVIETVDSLPKELRELQSSAAEIYIHPSGGFLYASSRGHDSISAFKVDSQSGRLTFVEREPIRGCHPRSFNIDPSGKWLLAAGRDSNTIAVFRIDPQTGGLVYNGAIVNSPAPICIEIQPGG